MTPSPSVESLREKIEAMIFEGVTARHEVHSGVTCYVYRGIEETAQRITDAILALLPSPEWKSMESAPRDGTEVILCVPRHDSGVIVGAAHWVSHDDTGGAWWWANESSGDYYASQINEDHGEPTHWQPLPPPPEASPIPSLGGGKT